jgi:hypothetical protein
MADKTKKEMSQPADKEGMAGKYKPEGAMPDKSFESKRGEKSGVDWKM